MRNTKKFDVRLAYVLANLLGKPEQVGEAKPKTMKADDLMNSLAILNPLKVDAWACQIDRIRRGGATIIQVQERQENGYVMHKVIKLVRIF